MCGIIEAMEEKEKIYTSGIPLNSDLELKKSKDSQRMEIQWKMEKEYW